MPQISFNPFSQDYQWKKLEEQTQGECKHRFKTVRKHKEWKCRFCGLVRKKT